IGTCARARTGGCADSRAFAAARNAANDGARDCAARRAFSRGFTSTAAFDVAFFVHFLNGLLIVDFDDLTGEQAAVAVAEADAVKDKRQRSLALDFARLLDARDVAADGRAIVAVRIDHGGGEAVAFARRLGINRGVEAD